MESGLQDILGHTQIRFQNENEKIPGRLKIFVIFGENRNILWNIQSKFEISDPKKKKQFQFLDSKIANLTIWRKILDAQE